MSRRVIEKSEIEYRLELAKTIQTFKKKNRLKIKDLISQFGETENIWKNILSRPELVKTDILELKIRQMLDYRK